MPSCARSHMCGHARPEPFSFTSEQVYFIIQQACQTTPGGDFWLQALPCPSPEDVTHECQHRADQPWSLHQKGPCCGCMTCPTLVGSGRDFHWHTCSESH